LCDYHSGNVLGAIVKRVWQVQGLLLLLRSDLSMFSKFLKVPALLCCYSLLGIELLRSNNNSKETSGLFTPACYVRSPSPNLDLLHSSSWRPTFTCSRVWYSSNHYKIPFKIMGKFVDPTSKFCFKSLKHGIMGSVSNLYICWTFVD
jgi:hypothetical protein